MPIVVEYGPDFGLAGQVAYTGGKVTAQNEERKRREAIAMAQAEAQAQRDFQREQTLTQYAMQTETRANDFAEKLALMKEEQKYRSAEAVAERNFRKDEARFALDGQKALAVQQEKDMLARLLKTKEFDEEAKGRLMQEKMRLDNYELKRDREITGYKFTAEQAKRRQELQKGIQVFQSSGIYPPHIAQANIAAMQEELNSMIPEERPWEGMYSDEDSRELKASGRLREWNPDGTIKRITILRENGTIDGEAGEAATYAEHRLDQQRREEEIKAIQAALKEEREIADRRFKETEKEQKIRLAREKQDQTKYMGAIDKLETTVATRRDKAQAEIDRLKTEEDKWNKASEKERSEKGMQPPVSTEEKRREIGQQIAQQDEADAMQVVQQLGAKAAESTAAGAALLRIVMQPRGTRGAYSERVRAEAVQALRRAALIREHRRANVAPQRQALEEQPQAFGPELPQGYYPQPQRSASLAQAGEVPFEQGFGTTAMAPRQMMPIPRLTREQELQMGIRGIIAR